MLDLGREGLSVFVSVSGDEEVGVRTGGEDSKRGWVCCLGKKKPNQTKVLKKKASEVGRRCC